MKKYYSALLIPILSCLHAQAGISAEAPSQPTIMDEVVVTASRSAETKKQISVNLTVVNREEIEQSPSRNVADLLAEKRAWPRPEISG